MQAYRRNIIITGGSGFIGSHVVRLFVNTYPDYRIINFDKLTYAGNPENLRDVEKAPNYVFIQGDICDAAALNAVFEEYAPDGLIHLAAESHVDRSIEGPEAFVQTNVLGTFTLLEAVRKYWKNRTDVCFHHVSTDEVFGSLGDEGFFTERTPYDPQSPYSASKAASDHFVRAYFNTYGIPVVITNCSNNYGPNHFPEKLIPLAITRIQEKQPIPVYGKGENVRDWLYAPDHARAIDLVFHKGKRGESYNVGGFNEWSNIDLIRLLCTIMDRKLGREPGESQQLITFVTDRPGHDHRYAIDAGRIKAELGWEPSVSFEEGLEKTVDWYLANTDWTDHVRNGSYRDYIRRQYNEE
ncbi:MAG: dTDP-glucose 4,6-dehydratase [Flavobacteriales bacterium]